MQEAAKGRQVEDVLQAFAAGLEHDREGGIAPSHLQQGLRFQPLLPEGSPLSRPAARDQERARSVLPEARAEERALPDLLHDELLDLVGLDEQLGQRRGGIGIGQVEGDPVVRPDRLGFQAERFA